MLEKELASLFTKISLRLTRSLIRHRTALSAKNYVEERDKLRLEFELEVLFLQSLGQIYLSPQGALRIMNDEELDKVRYRIPYGPVVLY